MEVYWSWFLKLDQGYFCNTDVIQLMTCGCMFFSNLNKASTQMQLKKKLYYTKLKKQASYFFFFTH